MDCLLDNLDASKWKEITEAEKTDDFIDVTVQRNHKKVNETTYCYMIANDEFEKTVNINFCKNDPLHNVNACEVRLSEDGFKITGIDRGGDIVVLI